MNTSKTNLWKLKCCSIFKEKIKVPVIQKNEFNVYQNNTWQPIKHKILKDENLIEQIHQQGYSIQAIINNQTLEELEQLFIQNHKINNEKGGMFYSIYSQNIEYRKMIHNSIERILRPTVETICQNYKMVLNSFVVKASGPESEFYLHQDTTGLDEWKYSPLSLWIPLQDVNENNGCLGIIPFSQYFFSPYRSISFPAPFDSIQSTVKQYLRPLRMKKGEVLIFDNRTLHHSYKNISGSNRVALICGLFPKEAKMQTCYKPVYEYGGKVELIEHDDEFLLTGKNFLIDCQKRPETGKSLGLMDDPYIPIKSQEFENLCDKYGVKKNVEIKISGDTNCNMIGEPV